MAWLFFILLLMTLLSHIVSESISDFETWPLATEGADSDAAQIEWKKLYTGKGAETKKGNVFIVENPIAHFSFKDPPGGCGTLEQPTKTAAYHHCVVATNAGFFNTRKRTCLGNLISDLQSIQSLAPQNANFGITVGNRYIIGYLSDADLENGVDGDTIAQLVTGVVWLVRKGKIYVSESLKTEDMSVQETGLEFANIVSARQAIGHDAHGRLMIVGIDGKSWDHGVALREFASLLIDLGMVNGINLDGGGSETTVVNGSLVNYPSDACPGVPASESASEPPPPPSRFSCERRVSSITCVHHRAYAPVRTFDAPPRPPVAPPPPFTESHVPLMIPAAPGRRVAPELRHQPPPAALVHAVHDSDREQTRADLRSWQVFGAIACVAALLSLGANLLLWCVFVRGSSSTTSSDLDDHAPLPDTDTEYDQDHASDELSVEFARAASARATHVRSSGGASPARQHSSRSGSALPPLMAGRVVARVDSVLPRPPTLPVATAAPAAVEDMDDFALVERELEAAIGDMRGV